MLINYNHVQKTTFFIVIIVFIFTNLISIFLVFRSFNLVNGDSNKVINIQISRNDKIISKTVKFNEEINIDQGYLKISSDELNIIATAPIVVTFRDFKTINLEKGSILVESKDNSSLTIIKNNFRLEKNGVYIFDQDQNKLIVLSGKSNFSRSEILPNKTLSLNDLTIKEFDRQDLTNTETLRSLSLASKIFKFDFPELTDVVPPKLIKINPDDGFTTKESKIKINGKTELKTQILINDSVSKADSLGNFSQELDLDEGKNSFKIVLVDEYGNKSEYSLNYFRE